MDSFIEQIIVKKTEGIDTLKRLGLVFGGSFLFFITTVFALYTGLLMIILLGFGALYLTWFFLQSSYIEYEYIVTNNDLDIDKILGKRKRKRLITIKINKAEEWGEYKEGKERTANVTVSAHDCGYKNLWYIISNHEKHGKVAVLFSPNLNVLAAINKHVPYSLRRKDIADMERELEEKTDAEAKNENEASE